MSVTKPNFIINVAEAVKGDSMTYKTHFLDPTVKRFIAPIGDQTGLTKTGVHLYRLPPNSISTVIHWHSKEDEWAYIIDTGDDAVLLLREEGSDENKEIKINKGDFIAFPAGLPNAHAFRSGEAEVVYLMGGSREPADMCFYPEKERRIVIERSGEGKMKGFLVEDKNVTEWAR